MIQETLQRYGKIVATKPFLVLAVVVVFTILGFIGNSMIQTEVEDMVGRLPGDIEVIAAFQYVNDEFGGGTDSGNIVIEINPSSDGEGEIRDIRDPKVIEYINILARKTEKLDEVRSVNSIADLVKVEGKLPKSDKTIKERLQSSPLSMRYINEDYTFTIIQIELLPDYVEEEVYVQLSKIVEQTPAPLGINTELTGDFAVSSVLNELVAPDMQRTSSISLMGILFILFFVVFRSIKNGLASLMAIIFGVIWAFGLIGWMGWTMTSVTSGALSMIMGIGIDFGIQMVTRFRQEMLSFEYETAMVNTISGVTVPMSTTTLAALIGFRAMSLGKLTFLAELGDMMSIGVFSCYLAALTVIPSFLIIWEKYFGGKKQNGKTK